MLVSFSRRLRSQRILLLALLALLACTAPAGCQKNSASFTIPPEDAQRKNPIEATPAEVEQGRRLYTSSDCAICHGKDGDGKGVLAKDISMNTHNWHEPNSLAGITDGELFFILDKGKGRMPAYEKRQTSEQMWQMVDYIRSLAGR